MPEYVLEQTQVVPRALEETFAFFSDPQNLETITPPWLRFRIVEAPERLEQGSRIRYRLALGRVPFGWDTEIAAWLPPRTFVDVQRAGPYRLWEHTHRFAAVEGGTELYDHVRYRVPGGPLAMLVHLPVSRLLRGIFGYRRLRLAQVLGPKE